MEAAIQLLLERDVYLLRSDANERSISHRLALYLQQQFAGWDVDCEYNRDGHEPKRLSRSPRRVSTDDSQGQTVYPDIIVHHRGLADNLLVIEMKKSTNPQSDNEDIDKLARYKEHLSYGFALFLRLGTGPHTGTILRMQWI